MVGRKRQVGSGRSEAAGRKRQVGSGRSEAAGRKRQVGSGRSKSTGLQRDLSKRFWASFSCATTEYFRVPFTREL